MMHEFSNSAMNTEIKIKIRGGDLTYARSAAHECFEHVKFLEGLLNLYDLGSDIAMVNFMKVGDIDVLSEDAAECLMLAFEAGVISNGALDVCMGEFFIKEKGDKMHMVKGEPKKGAFEIDEKNLLIRKVSEGKIDLGSIGKGFALDKIKLILKDWDIKNAFINFGGSSIFALGDEFENGEGWKINFGNEKNGFYILKNEAVSCSGKAFQGEHIIDARTAQTPEVIRQNTWAICQSAGMADAMSTAFMILGDKEIESICKNYPIKAAFKNEPDSEIVKYF